MPMLMTVSKGVPARAADRPVAHLAGELQHALALGEHLARDGLAARARRRWPPARAARYAARRGASVVLMASPRPHRLDASAQVRGIGEIGQQAKAMVVDTLARKIEVQARGLARKATATLRVRVEQRAQRESAGFRGARVQGAPRGAQGVMSHRNETWCRNRSAMVATTRESCEEDRPVGG